MDWGYQAFLRQYLQKSEVLSRRYNQSSTRPSFQAPFKQALRSTPTQILSVCCPWPRFSDPTWHFLLCLYRSLWDQVVNQVRKKLMNFNLGEALMWPNVQSWKCFWQWRGTVVKMRNWRPLERWNWSFQQWALFYADLQVGKSFPQAVNIPHSQPKWRFGEWKTEAGAETSLTSITLTYIKPKISQILQLLALTSFQKPTIKQYYQNENSVSNLIYFWFLACVRDLPVWISTL